MSNEKPDKIEIIKTGDTWMWQALGKDGETLAARTNLDSSETALGQIKTHYGRKKIPKPVVKS